MAQRKKDEVRAAILDAAFTLFTEQGYSETSIPVIARRAGFSTANVYIYFHSKIDILFTLYEPWLQERLDRFEASIRRIKDPRKRLERILMALWRDLPRESNGFANNVMQAVSTAPVPATTARVCVSCFRAGWRSGSSPACRCRPRRLPALQLWS